MNKTDLIGILKNQVKFCREDAKLSLRELADMTGLKLTSLYNLENGIGMPSFHTIVVLAKFYKKDLEYFIDRSRRDKTVNEKIEELFESIG